MAETTAHLKTTGMHCPSCSMLIDLTLDELDGVVSSKSDHAADETVVTYESETVDLDTILGAIRSVGYDAEPAS